MSDMKNIDLIVTLDAKKIVVNRNFSFTKRVLQHNKILTPRGMTAFSDIRIPYAEGYQAVEVLKGCATGADGRVTNLSEHAVNTIIWDPIWKAPDFCHMQEKAVSLIGIDSGGETELEYEITDAKTDREFLCGTELFQCSFPIGKKTFVIEIPEGTPFEAEFVKGAVDIDVAHSVTKEDGSEVHTWIAQNVPLIPEEEDAPDHAALSARLVYCVNHKIAAREFARKAEAAMKPSASVKTKTAETVAGAKTPAEKAHAIAGFVLKTVNHINYDLPVHDFMPRSNEVVLKTRYATSWERATLAAAMFRSCGMNCSLACGSDSAVAGKLIGSDVVRPAIVVKLGKSETWIDFTKDAVQTKPVRPANAFILKGGEFKPLGAKKSSPKDNLAETAFTATIAKDGKCTGKFSARLSGLCNPSFGMDSDKKTNETFLKSRIEACLAVAGISGAKVEIVKTTGNLLKGADFLSTTAISAQFACKEVPKDVKAGKGAIKMPKPAFDILERVIARERALQYKFAGPVLVKESFTVTREGWKGATGFVTPKTNVKNAVGKFSATAKFAKGKMEFKSELAIAASAIGPKDAAGFKQIVDAFNASREIVLM